MSKLIKILHIDPDYQITYLIYRLRTAIRTSVSLQTAILKVSLNIWRLRQIWRSNPSLQPSLLIASIYITF